MKPLNVQGIARILCEPAPPMRLITYGGRTQHAIRTDALRAAACAVIVLTFGIIVKRNR